MLLSWKHRLGQAAVAASDAEACFTCRNKTHKPGTKPSLLQVMVAVTCCIAMTYCSPWDTDCVFPSCKFLLHSLLVTSASYSFLFPGGNSSETEQSAWRLLWVHSPEEGWLGGKRQLIPSTPAPLQKWFPRPCCDPLLQPVAVLELSRAVKCGKGVLQRLYLAGSRWVKSSMGSGKITCIKNKSLLALKSALVAFTLKDTGCPPDPVLSSQLETGQ